MQAPRIPSSEWLSEKCKLKQSTWCGLGRMVLLMKRRNLIWRRRRSTNISVSCIPCFVWSALNLLRERPFDFQGGGGGFGQAGIFFTCFQRQNIFFSTIEGWIFFSQCMMREVIFFIVPFVWTIHYLQIYNKEQFFPQFIFHLGHTHSSSGGSVLVLFALIVLKHLHQGFSTPEDHHTTCSQARTQLLARGGGVRRGVRGFSPEFFFKSICKMVASESHFNHIQTMGIVHIFWFSFSFEIINFTVANWDSYFCWTWNFLLGVSSFT